VIIEMRDRSRVDNQLTNHDEQPDQPCPDTSQHRHAEQHGAERKGSGLRRIGGRHAQPSGKTTIAAATRKSAMPSACAAGNCVVNDASFPVGKRCCFKAGASEDAVVGRGVF
jgi:hypothetical protein